MADMIRYIPTCYRRITPLHGIMKGIAMKKLKILHFVQDEIRSVFNRCRKPVGFSSNYPGYRTYHALTGHGKAFEGLLNRYFGK